MPDTDCVSAETSSATENIRGRLGDLTAYAENLTDQLTVIADRLYGGAPSLPESSDAPDSPAGSVYGIAGGISRLSTQLDLLDVQVARLTSL